MVPQNKVKKLSTCSTMQSYAFAQLSVAGGGTASGVLVFAKVHGANDFIYIKNY